MIIILLLFVSSLCTSEISLFQILSNKGMIVCEFDTGIGTKYYVTVTSNDSSITTTYILNEDQRSEFNPNSNVPLQEYHKKYNDNLESFVLPETGTYMKPYYLAVQVIGGSATLDIQVTQFVTYQYYVFIVLGIVGVVVAIAIIISVLIFLIVFSLYRIKKNKKNEEMYVSIVSDEVNFQEGEMNTENMADFQMYNQHYNLDPCVRNSYQPFQGNIPVDDVDSSEEFKEYLKANDITIENKKEEKLMEVLDSFFRNLVVGFLMPFYLFKICKGKKVFDPTKRVAIKQKHGHDAKKGKIPKKRFDYILQEQPWYKLQIIKMSKEKHKKPKKKYSDRDYGYYYPWYNAVSPLVTYAVLLINIPLYILISIAGLVLLIFIGWSESSDSNDGGVIFSFILVFFGPVMIIVDIIAIFSYPVFILRDVFGKKEKIFVTRLIKTKQLRKKIAHGIPIDQEKTMKEAIIQRNIEAVKMILAMGYRPKAKDIKVAVGSGSPFSLYFLITDVYNYYDPDSNINEIVCSEVPMPMQPVHETKLEEQVY